MRNKRVGRILGWALCVAMLLQCASAYAVEGTLQTESGTASLTEEENTAESSSYETEAVTEALTTEEEAGETAVSDGEAQEEGGIQLTATYTFYVTTTDGSVASGADTLANAFALCTDTDKKYTIEMNTETVNLGSVITMTAGVDVTLTSASGMSATIKKAGTDALVSVSEGTLTLKNITIDNYYPDSSMKGSYFTLTGSGTINIEEGCTLQNFYYKKTGYAPIYVSSGGVVNLYSGAVIQNCTAYTGPVCASDSSSSICLYGGTISNNTAYSSNGGGICSSGYVFLYGGTIENNTAKKAGGGLYAGYLYMNDGVIQGNTAGTNGGGIYGVSELYLYGGTIQNNTAVQGGGISCASITYLHGGTVQNNTATTSGGGIALLESDSSLVLGYHDNTQLLVTENTLTDGTKNNLYLIDPTILCLNKALMAGSQIGVTTVEMTTETYNILGSQFGTANVTGADLSVFFCDLDDTLAAVYDGSALIWGEEGEQGSAGGSCAYWVTSADGSVAKGANTLAEAVALCTDTATEYTIEMIIESEIVESVATLTDGVTVTLTTAGEDCPYEFQGEGDTGVLFKGSSNSVLSLQEGNLTLKNITLDNEDPDTDTTGSYLALTGSGRINLEEGCTLQNFYCTTSGNAPVYSSSSGVVNLYSGAVIRDCTVYAGSIYAESQTGVINLYDGTIQNNTATYDGGGIYSSGYVYLYGGTIQNNVAGRKGGGLYANYLFMHDGLIEGNTATTNGGGIKGGSQLFLYGGTIQNNTADQGGGISCATITYLYGGTVQNNTATTSGGGISRLTTAFPLYLDSNNDTPLLVTENTLTDGTKNNLYLLDATVLCLEDALAAGSQIGVTTVEMTTETYNKGGAQFGTAEVTGADLSIFFCDLDDTLTATYDGSCLIWEAETPAYWVTSADGAVAEGADTLVEAVALCTDTATEYTIEMIIESEIVESVATLTSGVTATLMTAGEDCPYEFQGEGDTGTLFKGSTRPFLSVSKGALTLKNITIDNYYPDSSKNGSYLTLTSSGTVNIEEGCTIQNFYCTSSGYAPIYVSSGGTVNLYSGAVIQNCTGYGGSIYANSSSSKIYLYGGSIANNTASGSYGGGIYSSGYVYLYGGTIENNTAKSSGGGVYAVYLYLYDGLIQGNTSATYGGGINARDQFYLYGGTIQNNTADQGGGISCAVQSYLYGGIIQNNTATTSGGGISYRNTSNLLNLGNYDDTPLLVTENTLADGTKNNLYTKSNTVLYLVSALAAGSQIGVTSVEMATEDYNIIGAQFGTADVTDADLSVFFCDLDDTLTAVYDGSNLIWDGEEEEEDPTIPAYWVTSTDGSVAKRADTLAEAVACCTNSSKEYTIEMIIESEALTEGVEFTDGITVTLTTAGENCPYEFQGEGETGTLLVEGESAVWLLKITNANVTLENITLDGVDRTIDRGHGFIYVMHGATLNMKEGCTIQNWYTASYPIISSMGTFNLYDGVIKNNRTGSATIYITAYGVINMYGGVIEDNTAYNGGGIFTYACYTYSSMYGGIIRNNTADQGGGILACEYFHLYGGTITGNTATYGGGLNLRSATCYLHGGSITGNTAKTSGGGIYARETLKLGGDSDTPLVITGNTLTDGTVNNLHDINLSYITLTGELPADSSIGITTKEIGTETYNISGARFGTANVTDADLSAFFCDLDAGLTAVYDGSNLIWESGTSIAFDANGAEGTVPESIEGTEGSTVQLPEQGELIYENAIFLGWSTTATELIDKDGSEPDDLLTAGSEYTIGSEDTTLYAVWAEDSNDNGVADYLEDQSTITYDANGAEGTVSDAVKDLVGETITLPEQGELTYENAIFVGWSTTATELIDKDGSEPDDLLTAGSEYTIGSDDTTLYAVWAEDSNDNGVADYLEDQSTITYDANGAEGTVSDAVKDLVGETITLPEQGELTYENAIFVGWSTTATELIDKDGSEPDDLLTAGSEYTIESEDTTLYAVWAEDSNDNGVADYLEDQSTITYDANGAEGTVSDAVKDLVGETITLPEQGELTYENAIFVGWSTTATGLLGKDESTPEDLLTAGSEYTIESEDVTFYAVWRDNTQDEEEETPEDPEDETTITVEHYLENLEDEDFTLDALISAECTIGELLSSLTLEKTYEGFTLNAELTTANGQAVTNETTITDNMLVKLYYERSIYTVTYEGNGNDRGPTEVVEELAYKYGAEIVVKAPEELGMAYTDHTFLYWEGSILNPGDTWIVTSDKTLVAQWAEAEATVTTEVTTTAKTVKTGDTANTMLLYLFFGATLTAILAGYRRKAKRA